MARRKGRNMNIEGWQQEYVLFLHPRVSIEDKKFDIFCQATDFTTEAALAFEYAWKRALSYVEHELKQVMDQVKERDFNCAGDL